MDWNFQSGHGETSLPIVQTAAKISSKDNQHITLEMLAEVRTSKNYKLTRLPSPYMLRQTVTDAAVARDVTAVQANIIGPTRVRYPISAYLDTCCEKSVGSQCLLEKQNLAHLVTDAVQPSKFELRLANAFTTSTKVIYILIQLDNDLTVAMAYVLTMLADSELILGNNFIGRHALKSNKSVNGDCNMTVGAPYIIESDDSNCNLIQRNNDSNHDILSKTDLMFAMATNAMYPGSSNKSGGIIVPTPVSALSAATKSDNPRFENSIPMSPIPFDKDFRLEKFPKHYHQYAFTVYSPQARRSFHLPSLTACHSQCP